MAEALSGMTRWLVSFLLRRTCRSRLTRSTSQRRKVLHLDRPHRRVGGDDRGAVHVLPLRTRRGCLEEPLPFFGCQGTADRVLTLWEIVDVIRQCPPPATRLEHARQHAYVHIDRAVRDAGLVTRSLELGDRLRRDCRKRNVAKVFLDETQSLFFELDRARGALDVRRLILLTSIPK